MKHESKSDILIKLFIGILMTVSISQALFTSLFMTEELNFIMLIVIVPLMLLLYVMFRNKLSSLISAISLCLFLILILLNIIFRTGVETTFEWFDKYTIWIIDLGNGYQDAMHPEFITVTVIALAFITTLLVYIFLIKIRNFYILIPLLLSVFFIQLQLDIFMSKFSFVLCTFSILLYYFYYIFNKRCRDSSYDVGNRLKYYVFIIPVCCLTIAISFLFPAQSHRISVPWLDDKIDRAIETIANKIDEHFSGEGFSNLNYFSFESTGFGDSKSLGGNIKLSDIHVMNVKTEYPNLYLKASSKAYYNGHGWYDDNNEYVVLGNDINAYTNEINSDANELIIGSLMDFYKDKDSLITATKADIEFVNLKTKSLFIPIKAYELVFQNPITLFFDNEEMLSTDNIQSEEFNYSVNYYNISLNSDKFKENIRKSHKGFYKENLFEYLKNKALVTGDLSGMPKVVTVRGQSMMTVDATQFNAFQKKVNLIYRKYTQLTDTVPRVRQLAEELTADKDNNYDKAKAIEDYLSKNYPYTLKPGTPPRKYDFVDYFLFEGKEGYCTYYASAMTVMLRCIGIPARYVEGYMLPPKSENGVFQVTNQQAHAWVEAYFEGFGWIPFEPTSPFVANMYSDRQIQPNISTDMANQGYEDYMDMINQYSNNKPEIDLNIDSDFSSEEEDTNNVKFFVSIILFAVIISIILAFFVLAAVRRIKYFKLVKKIKNSDPAEAILLAYEYILKVLQIQSIIINPGETPSEFGNRVEKQLDFKGYTFNKTDFMKITDHFIKARYSKHILPEIVKKDMLDFIDVLLQLTSEKCSKIKFAIYKYVYGKI